MKHCNKCKQDKQDTDFYSYDKNKCIQCRREHTREARKSKKGCWSTENRKKNKSLYRMRYKQKIVAHYSNGLNCCAKCGYNDLRALSIDHINGSGAAHRKTIFSPHLYHWIRKNNFPEGFQVLCMNCQFIKRFENEEWGNKTKNFPIQSSDMQNPICKDSPPAASQ